MRWLPVGVGLVSAMTLAGCAGGQSSDDFRSAPKQKPRSGRLPEVSPFMGPAACNHRDNWEPVPDPSDEEKAELAWLAEPFRIVGRLGEEMAASEDPPVVGELGLTFIAGTWGRVCGTRLGVEVEVTLTTEAGVASVEGSTSYLRLSGPREAVLNGGSLNRLYATLSPWGSRGQLWPTEPDLRPIDEVPTQSAVGLTQSDIDGVLIWPRDDVAGCADSDLGLVLSDSSGIEKAVSALSDTELVVRDEINGAAAVANTLRLEVNGRYRQELWIEDERAA